ncbi:MAG TPA: MFS transporter [Methylomirabilota bacterium]
MTAARSSGAGLPPEPRRQFQVVATVWLILAAAYGVAFAFPIFFVALLDEFRWSRALTAGAMSMSTLLQGLLAPVTGIVVDRIGPRRVILAGVGLLGASSILAATIRTPWELYLYTGLVGAMGIVALGWVPMGVLLSHWVTERRGRMVGLAFSGMGAGIFVLGPLSQWLIDRLGWRAASLALGVAVLIVLLPSAWWGCRVPERRRGGPGGFRRDERDGGQGGGAGPPRRDGEATLADALRTRAFWALFAAYLLTPLAVFPVFTHQVAFAVDVGFPRLLVASIFGLMGLMSSLGRPLFGVVADRFGGAVSATISFGCTAGGAVALVAAEVWPHTVWLGIYAVLFGLGFGARGPIITAIATELFAGRRFGVIYGVLNMGNGVGAAIGPWFGGAVHDALGSYRMVFLSSIVFSALASACFWLARRRTP